ncbi:MAG: glycosyltransferase family 2 protein [Verrucomicrobiota bacterium]|jgi:glycosyltransferase involved in cell wall biosynthesis|nr:glycosyltransferase family 2 protein [Verrucomicrobiota bacterium]
MSSAAPWLTLIIPAYNEAEGIGGVLDAVLALPGAEAWSVVVVDDGSTDKTPQILAGYGERIRVIRHSASRGYGASLKTGILSTRSENVLFLDADGQHEPRDIPSLVSQLREKECVFTLRPKNAGIPVIRRPGKWLLGKLCNFLANRKIPDINSGLRAGRRNIYMQMLELLPDGFSFSTTSLMYVMRSRYSFVFVPIHCYPRVGTSQVRIVQDGVKTVLLALRLMMLFDPLRAFGYPAILLFAAGFIYQLYIFSVYRLTIVGGALLCMVTGVFLFCFGLLGDQVSSLRKEISSFNHLLLEERESREERDHVG